MEKPNLKRTSAMVDLSPEINVSNKRVCHDNIHSLNVLKKLKLYNDEYIINEIHTVVDNVSNWQWEYKNGKPEYPYCMLNIPEKERCRTVFWRRTVLRLGYLVTGPNKYTNTDQLYLKLSIDPSKS